MSRPLPPKKEVALALLERSSVHIHLDPRVASVIVPPWFKGQPQLVLQIGLNMPVPIPDLHLDEDGLSCTLSFNRSPFHCVVPWTSVFAMVGEDGRGMVWPDDVPVEVSRQTRPVQVAPAPKESSPEAARGRPGAVEEPARNRVGAPLGKAAAASPRRGPRRLADASPSDLAGGKKKKVATKRPQLGSVPDEPRARLSAVPPTPADSDERNPLRAAPDSASDSEPLGNAPPPARPKRELPPYLRVVK